MMYLAGDICKSRGEHERALEYFERGAAMNNGMCLRENCRVLLQNQVSLTTNSSRYSKGPQILRACRYKPRLFRL